ncbi:DUF4190 domain-containing protein [Tsukamurella paurometabola]|uniref:DUF4190 domain-containing protein n=1 Tax=Tsukamurella paurometabola TaxID=2061 RepID=UPI000676692F|nr:DUF4190 domain-containing protein [Tsukamurella paurometabola]
MAAPQWIEQSQYPPAKSSSTNGLAIGALIAGIICAPLGIVLGHIALRQINRSGERSRGLAVAGLVVGYVLTGLIAVSIVVLATLVSSVSAASIAGFVSAWTWSMA